MTRARYRKRADQAVTAVRLALDTAGFGYRKWGGEQRCKPGDWIVERDEGDVYTVDADSFAATYARVAPGRYVKRAPVWAEQADRAGSVVTKEGTTHHAAGDYIVSNDAAGRDAYAVSRETFESSYEPFEGPAGDDPEERSDDPSACTKTTGADDASSGLSDENASGRPMS